MKKRMLVVMIVCIQNFMPKKSHRISTRSQVLSQMALGVDVVNVAHIWRHLSSSRFAFVHRYNNHEIIAKLELSFQLAYGTHYYDKRKSIRSPIGAIHIPPKWNTMLVSCWCVLFSSHFQRSWFSYPKGMTKKCLNNTHIEQFMGV